jgi:hypothetical protein
MALLLLTPHLPRGVALPKTSLSRKSSLAWQDPLLLATSDWDPSQNMFLLSHHGNLWDMIRLLFFHFRHTPQFLD